MQPHHRQNVWGKHVEWMRAVRWVTWRKGCVAERMSAALHSPSPAPLLFNDEHRQAAHHKREGRHCTVQNNIAVLPQERGRMGL